MTRIDQFESVFKAADKRVFRHGPIRIQKILVVTDLPAEEAAAFARTVRSFLEVLGADDDTTWRAVAGEEFHTVGELLELVADESPDLICSYRNLHRAWMWPHTLGSHLDVLTQVAEAPVLVLPHPKSEDTPRRLGGTDVVVALTDHLAGEDRLVNWAARFTQPGGTLFLTHVEDRATFERYLDVISKIPSIDTETAREEILERLLREPRDYVISCVEGLAVAGLTLHVEPVVVLGHRLADHVRLVEERQADLLVLDTKDDDQLAMHGLAHPLAVELRHVPLLML